MRMRFACFFYAQGPAYLYKFFFFQLQIKAVWSQ